MYSAFTMKGENKDLTSLILVWNIMRKKREWKKGSLRSLDFRHASTAQLDGHLRDLITMKKISPLFKDKDTYYIVEDNAPLGDESATTGV